MIDAPMRELSSENTADYLRETGRVPASQTIRVRELCGGVSNVVLRVDVEEGAGRGGTRGDTWAPASTSDYRVIRSIVVISSSTLCRCSAASPAVNASATQCET